MEETYPDLLIRSDSARLLYRGLVHHLQGPPASGKTLLALAETAEIMMAHPGENVLWVDFNRDTDSIVPQLLEMGVTHGTLLDKFTLITPDMVDASDLATYITTLTREYALVVFEVGACSPELVSTIRETRTPQRVAQSTGAAVLVITSDRHPNAAFNAGANGAVYAMTAIPGPSPYQYALQILKDRPGQVRPRCGTTSQLAALISVDRSGPSTVVTLDPPA